jgi:hypothetical protein
MYRFTNSVVVKRLKALLRAPVICHITIRDFEIKLEGLKLP